MGLVYAEITLKNARDVFKAEDGIIKESEIRRTVVRALVDTGAWTLVINETIRKQLGLQVLRTEPGTLADGTQAAYNLVGPLVVMWKDRGTNCDALVLPDADEVLLGAIPLEAMDLTINSPRQELTGAHGDQAIHAVKSTNQQRPSRHRFPFS
jgi:clan AA aspartic protease